MKIKKKLSIDQLKKLFELRIMMETYEDFLSSLQQMVSSKVGALQNKIKSVSEFVEIPLDKRIDFDFKKSVVIWEDENAIKKTD